MGVGAGPGPRDPPTPSTLLSTVTPAELSTLAHGQSRLPDHYDKALFDAMAAHAAQVAPEMGAEVCRPSVD